MGSFLIKWRRLLLRSIMLLYCAMKISCAITADGEALLSFKTSIVGSDGVLLQWIQEDPDPCNWKGVTCDAHTKRVTSLMLGNHKLIGPIVPEIGKLNQLKTLALHGNSLYGSIPPELGNCTELQQLYLQGNYLGGVIPPEFGNLLELQTMDLSSNALSGPIPQSLAKLTKLASFNASMNFLRGSIPSDGPLIKFAENSFIGNQDLCGKQIGVVCKNNASSTSTNSGQPSPVKFFGCGEPPERNNRYGVRRSADGEPRCSAFGCDSVCFLHPRGPTDNAQGGSDIGVRGDDPMPKRFLRLEFRVSYAIM